MEIISSIRREAREEMLTLLLQHRFSALPAPITEKLNKLSGEQLKELGVELFNIQSLSEVEEWLFLR